MRRLLPLLILSAIAVAAYALGLHRYLDLAQIEAHRESLKALVAARPLVTAIGFVLAYTVAIAISLPGGAILTILGGFLFGTVLGAGLAVVGATAGAALLFLIARTSLGEPLRRRAGPWLARMEAGFRDNALSYLLVLRLVPLFPFWLVNIVPAFLGVPLRTYVLATALGIIPGSLVYASVGNGLGAVLDAGGRPDLGIILSPPILLPLLGLALLALIPVVYKRWQTRRRGAVAL
jgi:uncharacterized membrane protein YdjX (TVP38/TMEM64 family)